ncbi:MAG: hypothetical protein K6F69_04480 [Treponema sp.]|nr:hypothetical protein [Treponema sp.]
MRNSALKSFISGFALLEVSFLLSGCGKSNTANIIVEKPLVIWTNKTEFASYTELFNLTHDDCKAVVVYKQNPSEALESIHDETPPDIVIGTYLKNERTRKDFHSLDFLFTERQLEASSFYQNLLEAGKSDDEQYLLPVSFNIPAIMFSMKQSSLINDTYMLSIDQIRDIAGLYNAKNKQGAFTAMGFAPSWEPDFMYLVTMLMGTSYMQKQKEFTWNEKCLKESLDYLKAWTRDKNGNTSSERDFEFKYLFTPKYKQITSDRCLFAYVKSDELFSLSEEQLQNVDFRWIHQNHKIPVADTLVSMGIYKHSYNSAAAEKFIVWFMNEESQKKILERDKDVKLNSVVFGIAGGFSSIKNVTEKDFPLKYKLLLGNLPLAEYLETKTILPPRWSTIKEKVIIPYLEEASAYEIPNEKNNEQSESSEQKVISLSERLDNWTKQNY